MTGLIFWHHLVWVYRRMSFNESVMLLLVCVVVFLQVCKQKKMFAVVNL